MILSKRSEALLAANLLGLLVIQVMLFFVLVRPSQAAPPIIEWIDSNYVPGDFCPGDVVTEIVTIDARAEALVVVFSTFVRAGPTGDNVQPQKLGDAAAVIIPSARVLEDQDPTWLVPDLPPGDYIRAIAAGTLFRDTEPIFRQQPFSIRDDCFFP